MAIILTNDFPPVHGGIQRYMSRMAEQFVARGIDVVVIARSTEGCQNYDRGAHYRTLRYGGRGKLNDFLQMAAALYRVCRMRSDFVLASLWFPAGLAACFVPKRMRGRLVVLVHGAELRPSRRGLRLALMRFVLQRADVVVANSRYTRDLVRACGVERTVAVVNCGVDPFAIQRDPSDRPTILAVGRLMRRKGFDRLIEALPSVLNEVPNALCEIVGVGPLRADLERSARILGVAHCVVFRGAITDDELMDAYKRAWCFALPVRNEHDDVEGFGIVYLEAAMAGLASVGGCGSGAADAIADGETGILVDGNDSAQVARAIVELLVDPERSRRMGQRGRERAIESFSWDKTAANLLDAIA